MLKDDQVDDAIIHRYIDIISSFNCFNDLYRYLQTSIWTHKKESVSIEGV
jgi:hypothetical protein